MSKPMKYIIIIGDGMADEPIHALGGKTPLAAAHTPMLDMLAGKARLGTAQTVPPKMAPGSDVACLSVLGFSPSLYYTGRSPLEALSIGIPLQEGDVAIRLNLVSLSEAEDTYAGRHILDHSAGEIDSETAKALLAAVSAALPAYDFSFEIHPGVSYRHCLIWKAQNTASIPAFNAPHDILGKCIGPYLPADGPFLTLMEQSHHILSRHPINDKRKNSGENPANSFWFWGAGTKPQLPNFQEKTGKTGIVISAVDLLKGIGVAAGMSVAHVPGANATLHTNYAGKVDAALQALLSEEHDFALIHVEAPDEMSHRGDLDNKIRAIEYVDQKIVAPVYERLRDDGVDFRLLVMPDHATPLRIRTHSHDAVPFLLYDSRHADDAGPGSRAYNEAVCRASNDHVAEGHLLIEELFCC